jgi:hypothetical protein
MSRGSSVSIVCGYGLDDLAIKVRSPAETIFCLNAVSKPALRPTEPHIQWVLGGPFPGAKRGQGVMPITHPI